MKNFWISFAVAQMRAAGQILKSQDADAKGNDDMAGSLLVTGATALDAYLSGNAKGFRGALKTIADSINAFLATAE